MFSYARWYSDGMTCVSIVLSTAASNSFCVSLCGVGCTARLVASAAASTRIALHNSQGLEADSARRRRRAGASVEGAEEGASDDAADGAAAGPDPVAAGRPGRLEL